MEGRQRLGAVLVVAGLALVAIGGVSLVSGSGATAAQPTSSPPAATVAPATGPAPTLAVTPAPSAAPTPPPTEDTLAIVRAFFADFQAAVRTGAQVAFLDNLGQAAISRYGRTTCEAYLASRDPVVEQAYEIVSVSGAASWDYVTDELTTTVPDTFTVAARVTSPDPSGVVGTVDRELHIQVIDGKVFWFTDCGAPLSSP